MDFHAIPFRGDPAALDNHYLPRRGKAGPSVLGFFAQEQESRVLCYANANLTRTDQPGELMCFVEFWKDATGKDPQWLYFDSKVVPYPELSRVNQRGIQFVTIRRRGAAVIRRLRALPPQAWQSAVTDTPRRCHQRIRFVNEAIRLPGYDGTIRQLAVDGLGREQPTSFLSNNVAETARSHGFDRSAPKQAYRRFVETGGQVEVHADRLVVRFDKRSHNPILREAELDKECPPIPWLGNLPVSFAYP